MKHLPIVCVAGARGFIGSNLIPALSGRCKSIRALSRAHDFNCGLDIELYEGDLFNRISLDPFLKDADILINLVHVNEAASDEDFTLAVHNLALAARDAGVKKVLHISTAMVVGVTRSKVVDEQSALHPATLYEHRKCQAERIFQEVLAGKVDYGVIRPTAVFGHGSENLRKLCSVILDKPAWYRTVLRFLHGKRNMHLVSIHKVVAAICFLAFLDRKLDSSVFFVSEDEEPSNNYQSVEFILGKAMGVNIPKTDLHLPSRILSILLSFVGRSQSNPELIFDGTKLNKWGFIFSGDFEGELEKFGASYVARRIKN